MEVRCGKCNKLFRVADDKITGTGIKFPCTRCGASVRITHEDFEQYTVSRSAVSFLDRSEPKPMPVSTPLSPEAADSAAMETVPQEHGPQTLDLAAQTTHEEAPEEKPPLFVEPDQLFPVSAAKTEPAVELKPEPLMQPKQTAPPVEPQPEPTVELKPEPLMQTEPKTDTPVETPPQTKLEPLFVPRKKAKPAPERETLPEPIAPAPPVSPTPAPPVQQAMPKEYVRPAAPGSAPPVQRTVKGPTPASTPSRSGRMVLVLVVTLIIAALAAYGIFFYLQPSPHKGKEAVHEAAAIEELKIINPVGSVDANGDLLISGAIENTTEKERTTWYVVAMVYDAQGTELSKIRFLNGKQIYTQRDYDIMAGRGANIAELKEKGLQEHGVVIPPKGTVKFEMRYLQPQAGVANFNVQSLPFDPVQVQKEVAGEIK